VSDPGDIALPAAAANFSVAHKATRVAWALVWFFGARWTPRSFAPWRRFLLRLFGAKMGERTDVRGSARVWYPANLVMEQNCILAEGVDCYNMASITLRLGTVVSQRAFLCAGTHDYSKGALPLVTRPIEIGPYAWIAAEAFVGPGAIVAEGCVVGARAVVNGPLEPWGVYAGNPARRIKERALARRGAEV
jgi:putative colanic acid biosynthesis acetyltransferase WcaF